MKSISTKKADKNKIQIKRINSDKPRLTVFRSLKNIYAQIIDDNKKITLVSASSKEKNIEKMPKSKVSELLEN